MSLPDDTPVHTSIVQISATDLDASEHNRRITYRILQNETPPGFYIDADKGLAKSYCVYIIFGCICRSNIQ